MKLLALLTAYYSWYGEVGYRTTRVVGRDVLPNFDLFPNFDLALLRVSVYSLIRSFLKR